MNDTDSHLLSLIDSLPMPMALVDENGAVRFLNRKFEETFGYTPEDLPTLDDWHRKACPDPDYRQKTLERWSLEVERAKGGEYMRPFELAARCKNGEERQVEFLYSMKKGNILAVFLDLTERKRSEEKVKASELRYRRIFDLSPAGIGLATREGEIIDVNPAMQEIFGYSLEELTGKNVSDFYLSPVDREALLQILDSQGFVKDLEVKLRRKDRTIFDALLNISLVNCNGRSCLQTICIDITERQKAEELLRTVFILMQSLNEGVWVIDADAITTFVNPRMAEMLGYSVEEMTGRPLFSFMDESEIQSAQNDIERRKAGIREQHDFEFLRKDGTRIYTSLETAPLYDEAGNYIGAIAGVADITEKRRMEEELLRTAAIVQSSDDAIIGKSLNGEILAWNPGAELMYGYSKKEAIGKPISLLLPEGLSEEMADILARLKRGEKVEHYETLRRRKDGTLINVSLTVSPIRDRAGNIIGASTIARDITSRKKAEEERERVIAELSDALAKVKTLSGLLPICASCKKIRDDKGYWTQIESYISEHSGAEFSHGICPECTRKLYPECFDKIWGRGSEQSCDESSSAD